MFYLYLVISYFILVALMILTAAYGAYLTEFKRTASKGECKDKLVTHAGVL
jgi:hypothetical protein